MPNGYEDMMGAPMRVEDHPTNNFANRLYNISPEPKGLIDDRRGENPNYNSSADYAQEARTSAAYKMITGTVRQKVN